MTDTTQAAIGFDRLTNRELEAGWLTTAASQVFFMQLGFLCFEVGYVDHMWSKSIIIKNIEDTFICALTFVLFGYTLSAGQTISEIGLLGSLDNILLYNVDRSLHETVFIHAAYATSCVTIISGAVLERMKNIAYMTYIFLICLLQYSLAACWVWNENGWLYKLGVIDCAGSFVVHGVGGIAGLMAAKYLGPRRGSAIDPYDDNISTSTTTSAGSHNERTRAPPAARQEEPKLIPIPEAKQPIIMAIGAFILWYGWFAFNITSPIVGNIESATLNLGQSGLNSLLAPCCSALTCLIYSKYKNKHGIIGFEDLLSCILAGLVCVTGSCYTIAYWAACIIGILVTPAYFLTNRIVREKLVIDDPLCISSIHLVPGFLGLFLEGVFADGTVSDPGLFYGGFKHFGYQTLAVIIGFISQMILNYIVWKLLLEWLFMNKIYKSSGCRVSQLDTYLGMGYFDIDIESVLRDMLLCQNQTAKQMLLSFKGLCHNYAKSSHLDFLIVITRMRKIYRLKGYVKKIKKLFNLYCIDNSNKSIHLNCDDQQTIITLLKKDDNNAFDIAYFKVFESLKSLIIQFLNDYRAGKGVVNVKLKDKYYPFHVDSNWRVKWMTDVKEITPKQDTLRLKTTYITNEIELATQKQKDEEKYDDIDVNDMDVKKLQGLYDDVVGDDNYNNANDNDDYDDDDESDNSIPEPDIP